MNHVLTNLIASVVLAAAQVVPGSQQTIEVWVVLSEPALASLPREAVDERAELRRRIERQQDDIMAQLAALGAVESARVQVVRNAIAIRLPSAAIESAKKIKGVTAVHAISHRNRIDD